VTSLIIRNVEVDGRGGLDVRLEAGRIAAIGPGLAGPGETLDGRGGALIPGLADHHVHLLATAARRRSVTLDDVSGPQDLRERLAAALRRLPPDAWLRATGYHERHAGPLARADLDAIAPHHPVRVQHQTGALWIVNSAALQRLGPDLPEAVERGADGAPTGRLWRADAWLRSRVGADPPPLAPIGAELAAAGVTALTDATVTTDADAAGLLAAAHRRGEAPQRLLLMSGHDLVPPADGAFAVGPLKIVPDERDLPSLDDLAARIAHARRTGRPVAVHCVTAAELALTLAAFEAAGAAPGDRIEHGGVIDAAAIGAIRGLGLTVVTQPGFVFDRGDRFAAETPPAEHADLYRCASLLDAHVPVAGSSDAPYGPLDPWTAIRAAMTRRTRSGAVLAAAEAIPARRALDLWLADPAHPGGPPRRLAAGAPADLCLLRAPLAEVLADPAANAVAATIIGGAVAFLAG
jgi:predicted amidohydrolase YtcJ